ncbi:MAG: hypothetical protein M3X11_15300, partial [Acidobacteriota bacterium]|nr:hypothetical protein [Acidobacteriota bacterium]
MRKSSLAFGIIYFLFIGLSGAWPLTASTQQAQQTSGALTREERVRVFEQVWRAINDNYYDKSFRGVDWRQQRELFRSQVELATSGAEFYRVLRQMIGKLGDAHTRIYSPEDGFDRYRPSGLTVGLIVRRIEGQPIV